MRAPRVLAASARALAVTASAFVGTVRRRETCRNVDCLSGRCIPTLAEQEIADGGRPEPAAP